jgi:hypothetical protein
MESPMQKLIGVAGQALSTAHPILPAKLLELAGALAGELIELLERKNGFYAFESALHVMPAQSRGHETGLVDWNSEQLWIDEYQGLAKGLRHAVARKHRCADQRSSRWRKNSI